MPADISEVVNIAASRTARHSSTSVALKTITHGNHLENITELLDRVAREAIVNPANLAIGRDCGLGNLLAEQKMMLIGVEKLQTRENL
ncbi:hypothetical protein GFER_10915 [Geoalkalibacter ferrihydriticus DSM 17813]|uniref:Uncharacterized protein n=1 Tax=Geoalkalibacter ferrihydriticus DSM 17813 TaxID=1121915 RepID=A0A0C2HI75_9BACT|nr:hypothetical protein GFER_10915 [Geoalkalibacter ferrihydriticus DSM 17813]